MNYGDLSTGNVFPANRRKLTLDIVQHVKDDNREDTHLSGGKKYEKIYARVEGNKTKQNLLAQLLLSKMFLSFSLCGSSFNVQSE